MRLTIITDDQYGQAVAQNAEGTLYGTKGYPLTTSDPGQEVPVIDTTATRAWRPIEAYGTKHFADGGSALEIDWSDLRDGLAAV